MEFVFQSRGRACGVLESGEFERCVMGGITAPRSVRRHRRRSVIGGLVVTHGRLAEELLSAAETIEDGEHRKVVGLYAVPLEWSDTVDQARAKIAEALARLSEYQGVIIFTDMFGGTPSNISLSFLQPGRVEIVTGVNLPMIVKFVSLKSQATDIRSIAHLIREKGSKSIRVASDLLGDETGEQGS